METISRLNPALLSGLKVSNTTQEDVKKMRNQHNSHFLQVQVHAQVLESVNSIVPNMVVNDYEVLRISD
jgi:hypothetical protein